MTYYPGDSTVEAAILCEYGYFNIFDVSFRWQKRIKIFTKEGLDFLIITVPVQNKGNVRGFVYNLVEGKTVKERISNDHIFLDRITDMYYNVRLHLPMFMWTQ